MTSTSSGRVLTATIDTVGFYLPDRADEAIGALTALADADSGAGTAYGLATQWAARHAYLCGRVGEVESAVARWRATAAPTADTQAQSWVVTASMAIHSQAWAGRVGLALAHVDELDVRDYEGSHHLTLWMVWAAGDALRWTGRVADALDRAELAIEAEAAGYRRLWYSAELAASRAAAGASPRELVATASRTGDSSIDRWWPWAMARLVDAVATAADGRPLDDDLLIAVDGWLRRLERYVGWLRVDAPIRSWAEACLRRSRAQRAFLAGSPDPGLWDPVVADFEDRGGRPYAALARVRRATARAAADGATPPACEDDLLVAWRAFTEMGMTVPQQDAASLANGLRVRLPSVDDDDEPVLPGLTEREREVLALVALGCSNKEVGQRLFISPKTASVHLSNTMRKLGVASRTQAVLVAHAAGLASDI